MKPGFDVHLWLARLFVAIVVTWNLQAAMIFLAVPERYAPAFELSGMAGEAAVRGMAVLFLMWNVPYLVALWNPRQHRISLWEALAMQSIGLLGETCIFSTLAKYHTVLSGSILRFTVFDAAGVVFLAGALSLTRKKRGTLLPPQSSME